MKKSQFIEIKGARTHNLKNINTKIPVNKITCVYGPSGSGKTSLVFHTLFLESKRRMINSFPSDLKFFWDIPQVVDVDSIGPILPVMALPQSNPVLSSRPIVADSFGLTELFQRLFFQYSTPVCCQHGLNFEGPISNIDHLKDHLANRVKDPRQTIYLFLDQEEFKKKFPNSPLPSRSYNEETGPSGFDHEDQFWEVYRFRQKNLSQLPKKLIADFGVLHTGIFYFYIEGESQGLESFQLEKILKCPRCDSFTEFKELSLDHFSPYNALGACSSCNGHGMNLEYDPKKIVKDPELTLALGAVSFLNFSRVRHLGTTFLKEAKKAGFDLHRPFHQLDKSIWKLIWEGKGQFSGVTYLLERLEEKKYKKNIRIFLRGLKKEVPCEECEETRLSPFGRGRILIDFKVGITELLKNSLEENLHLFENVLSDSILVKGWSKSKTHLVKKIHYLLKLAQDIGIGHLVLTRKIKSLTPSEYQRILLGRFLSFTGSGNLIILDEPSLGLGENELKKLQIYLNKLRDFGNTLIIVDHSPFLQSKADYLIKMGPLSGSGGGTIVFEGESKKVHKSKKYIGKKLSAPKGAEFVGLKKASGYGLSFDDIKIPVGGVTRVYGKTGSGKSTVILKILGNLLYKKINGEDFFPTEGLKGTLGPLKKSFEKVLIFVSSEKKGNSRSTLGTYSGLSTFCRKHFSGLEISKKLGLKDGHFSPNSPIGKCLGCEGKGLKTVEMSFLEDLDFVCPDCKGKKLRPYVANIHDGNFTFSEAMELPMDQVLSKIKLTPKGLRIKELMEKLNIDYLSLGRSLTSLSGGEFQRIQLVSALSTSIRNSILFFENISSGLSHLELDRLGTFLQELSLLNNTIIIIDQNPELQKYSQSSLHFKDSKVELLFH